VKLKRHGAVLATITATALALTACGSNPTPSGGGSEAGGSSASNGPAPNCGGKQNLAGEGSTAQKNAIDVFVQAYQAKCPGFNVAYNPTGSGAGVKQFNAGLVDFGGSDSALKADAGEVAAAQARCKGNEAWNLPMVFGPVALAYKLNGVDKLVLNGEVTAKIFSGAIKTWNDPAIAALNNGVQLPATPINVIYRSDSSGTTDNFQQYLAAAGKGAWTKPAGKTFNGSVGTGSNGSAGVAQSIAGADGTIGYIELAYAQDNKLSMAQLDSGSGPVELTDDSVGKAISGAQFTGQGNDLRLDLKSVYGGNTADAYPLILATYEIVCSKGYDPAVSQAVKAFLTVAATDGQDNLPDAGSAKLPAEVQQKLLTAIQAIG
jgi:phosphate transport system substrate-binding protein